MDVFALIIEVLKVVAGAVALLDGGSGLFSSVSGVFDFGVQAQRCTREACPGSQFTLVGAAWANIGYLAHSDVLHMLRATEFGLWAPLIYACAGIGALIGVAMNMPPKGYVWFFVGPSLYSFLVGTTQPIRGVDWVVANQQQDLTEVWRNAEVGLANLSIVRRDGIPVTKYGPGREYLVAMPLVFLDSLFSNSANYLVEWSGLYRQAGTGGSNSNLARPANQDEGPWYLLSNLKWGILENIVGGTARNPGVRDALVTFLTSECGDQLKKAVDSGKYMAASQARGVDLPDTVMVTDPDFVGPPQYDANSPSGRPLPAYGDALHGLNVTSIPTPRTVLRLFQESSNPGAFGSFAEYFHTPKVAANFFGPVVNKPIATGRGQNLLCSEYLYTLVQAFRHEAGHAYWQMIRSAPNGIKRDEFLKTLFYGWDIRQTPNAPYASSSELSAFVKHLILLYIIRNELLFAPQVTQVDQRFAPSEQNRINAESHVRTMGSKAKFAELYNWAVLMLPLQGILLYFVIMAYPFVAMMMVLPGHHKTFFTWISFFAWLKLWDVGFAFVQVLERSVWAMIGNQSSASRIAGMVLNTARYGGGIGVGAPSNQVIRGFSPVNLASDNRLSQLPAIPAVCSLAQGTLDGDSCGNHGADQTEATAFFLFDRMLLLSANADLDLANGYYIYIMAALYMAVPGVTGQLVLGAKAGAASTAGSLFSGVSGEAANAAKAGFQHDAVNRTMSNNQSLGQAAYSKAMRKSGMAAQVLGLQNDNLDRDLKSGKLDGAQAAIEAGASALGSRADSFSSAFGVAQNVAKSGAESVKMAKSPKAVNNQPEAGGASGAAASGGSAAAGKDPKDIAGLLGTYGNTLGGMAGDRLSQQGRAAKVFASGTGVDTGWATRAYGMESKGAGTHSDRLSQQAGFDADMAVWEARSAFASHASAQAGIAGMNAGNLSATKPTSMIGQAMEGDFGRPTQDRAQYAGSFMHSAGSEMRAMAQTHGSSWISSQYGGGYTVLGAATEAAPVAGKYLSDSVNNVLNDSSTPAWLKENLAPISNGAFQTYEKGNGARSLGPATDKILTPVAELRK